jgi:hypothetical protein
MCKHVTNSKTYMACVDIFVYYVQYFYMIYKYAENVSNVYFMLNSIISIILN